jgi:inorganic pyrophosphatase
MTNENYNSNLKREFTLWIAKGKIKRSIQNITNYQDKLTDKKTFQLMSIEIDNLQTWLRSLKDIQNNYSTTIELTFNRYKEFVPKFEKLKEIE